MRKTFLLLGVLATAFVSLGTTIAAAARAFTEFIAAVTVRFVRTVSHLPTLFAVLDGPSLSPAIAGYGAPPDSFLRHEAFVPRRSAARGG